MNSRKRGSGFKRGRPPKLSLEKFEARVLRLLEWAVTQSKNSKPNVDFRQ